MGIKKIHSPSNPLIKEMFALKKGKGEGFLIEGLSLIETALCSPQIRLKALFFTRPFFEKNSEFFNVASDALLVETTDRVIKALTDTVSPQGIVALVTYNPLDLEELTFNGAPLVVLCDAIGDPGNLGTLIRSATAFGTNALITLPNTCNIFSPKVIRASAGSIFHLPIISCSHREAIEYLKTRQIQLLCADAYGDRDLSKCDLRSATAIVLGNESHGPTAEIKGASDYRVSIPMVQNTESLNVAVAGSIFLFEAMIQRKNQTRPSHPHCGRIKGFANLMTDFKEEG